MIDSNNNIILSDKLVALIGVEDLIIVDTPDALLICKREDGDMIKDLVKGLDEKYK
jgi:mannose-1-phosphate guanylyltransferase/mannose-6-phosphate isomerase